MLTVKVNVVVPPPLPSAKLTLSILMDCAKEVVPPIRKKNRKKRIPLQKGRTRQIEQRVFNFIARRF
jgi:hypothetical protein